MREKILSKLGRSRTQAAGPGDQVYLCALGRVKFQALGEAGAAEGVLGRHLGQVQAHGIFQRNVVMISHQHVVKEAEPRSLSA